MKNNQKESQRQQSTKKAGQQKVGSHDMSKSSGRHDEDKHKTSGKTSSRKS
ncbi:MAG: hypothetical protein K0Q74_181 [Gammaproteobacteria bacterium]|jgi:hypothetical protein|nr:hypothetical protein [Gammaproteobacteria bacterium]